MAASVELVTPDQAKVWLETMPTQRKIRPHRVREYCVSRRTGHWTLHHQGIAFDTNGRLRDGQHRLQMVVETGMTTPFLVVRNVSDESLKDVDQQLARTMKDCFHMASRGDYTCSALALAGAILFPPQSLNNNANRLTRDQILDVLELYEEGIGFAEKNANGILGMTRAVRCLVARAYYHAKEPIRLQEFCRTLRDGIPLSDDASHDRAALSYRNYLLTVCRMAGTSVEIEKYRKGQTALEAFLNRQPMTKIYGTERDVFPLTKEIAMPD